MNAPERRITRRNAIALTTTALAAGVAAVELIGPDRRPAYPEGLSLDEGRLRMADIATGEIVVMDAGTLAVERTIGLGDASPTAIAPYGRRGWIVACHQQGSLMTIDDDGRTTGTIERASDGGAIPTPNDCTPDGEGGAYATSAGTFARDAPRTGSVLHVTGTVATRMTTGLHYANGIAYDPATRDLFYTEHFERRLWRARADGARLRDATVIATFGPPRTMAGWPAFDGCGPDNLRIRRDGNLQVPMYGEGRVLVVTRDGTVANEIEVPCRFVTDTVEAPDGAMVACGAQRLTNARGDGYVGRMADRTTLHERK